jgi:hypothetical protein
MRIQYCYYVPLTYRIAQKVFQRPNKLTHGTIQKRINNSKRRIAGGIDSWLLKRLQIRGVGIEVAGYFLSAFPLLQLGQVLLFNDDISVSFY